MNVTAPSTNPFLGQPFAVCMKCGLPIKQNEIAMRIRDAQAIDYENRGEFHDIIFFYHSDCKEEMLKWNAEGIRGAVERQKAIESRLKAEDSKR